MATWPSGTKASTTNLDAGTDQPSLARADIKQNVDNVNSIIDTFNVSTHTDGDILVWDSANGRFNVQAPVDTGITSVVAGTGISVTELSAGGVLIENTVVDTGITSIVAGTGITVNTLSEGGVEISATADGGITTVAAGTNIDVTVESTGGVTVSLESVVDAIELKDYKETIYSLGTTSGALSIDVANGNVQTVTLDGNSTLDGFANAEVGQSLTLIVTQDGTGSRTLTFGDSANRFLFAGGEDTLSTAGGSIDIVSIVYDGTTYYASLAKGFA